MDLLIRVDKHAPRQASFECVYIRQLTTGFELVAQWIAMVGDDFTFEEEVIATADTPNGLPIFNIGYDFAMPPAP